MLVQISIPVETACGQESWKTVSCNCRFKKVSMWKGTLSDTNLYTSTIFMTVKPEEVKIKVIQIFAITRACCPGAVQCWPVLVSPHHELSVPGVRAVQLLDIKTVLLRTLQRTNSSGRGHTYEMSTWPVEGGVYVEWKSADNCGG